MAEIRKYNPDAGEGIARLVRQQMGDVRPNEPGERPVPDPVPEEQDSEDSDDAAASFSGVPNWDESGPTFQF